MGHGRVILSSSFQFRIQTMVISFPLLAGYALISVNSLSIGQRSISRYAKTATQMSMSSIADTTSSWEKLQSVASSTKVGAALDEESNSRLKGTGAPFVQNNLRLFGTDEHPKLTLYRDHAGEIVRKTHMTHSVSYENQ